MKNIDPRQLAFDILNRVEAGAFSDLALDAVLVREREMDPRDRGLLTELVYGVLRQRGPLDFVLARFCSQPLAKVEPKVLNLLRLGAYQLLFLDRVPAPAAVDETVEAARRAGLARATGFINGILRSLLRARDGKALPDPAGDPLSYLEHALSLPGWLASRWLAELGREEAFALADALRQPAPFALRVNTLRTDREAFLEGLARTGFEAVPTSFAPEGVIVAGRGAKRLPGADEGWFQVQDEASMLIPHLLAPLAGERILDACAAPGGKTTEIAALTEGRARILALDIHPKRVALIAAGARRLHSSGIETRCWDLTAPPEFLPPGSFDRVLVDAPCSGLGVLRRNPEIRWRRTEAEIRQMATLQQTILRNVAGLVRPGGVLLYSLCTLTPEETEGVVAAFLDGHPEFVREDLRTIFPEWLELFDDQGALRTFPHRHGGMDAFFAVRFRKNQ
ncbi:MAG TPA: 16S rRNA (cytosine(967)-C(5))-methyltransferase RsmB [Desulfuromonadales bacterium]|nr:16S rRNA (cytosine(967)-C(5))-methyltransferase RsmB [Desulfuromonadales bacterium]